MSSVSRETVFYRVAWVVVAAAFVAACAFGVVSVGSAFSAHPNVAASVPKATANMVKPPVVTIATTTLDSVAKQACGAGKARAETVESGTGKIIAIHC